CPGCAVGCNISPGERYGEIRRVENRYHGEINGYFLCDRGRFGYGHVNRKDRPRRPLLRAAGDRSKIGWQTVEEDVALERVRALLASNTPIYGIGSPRASVEANVVLRALVGGERFSSGMSRADAALNARIVGVLRDGPVAAATLREIDEADAVLVLGED